MDRFLIKITAFFCLLILLHPELRAQADSTRKGMIGLDSFFRRQKGLLGKLAHNLVTDTGTVDPNTPVRNDLIYSRYEGRIIRYVEIQRLDFGTPITDTTRNLRNNLTRLATFFHHKSREYVIRNNLFFRAGDKVFPYLLADNERHLRDQPYLLDAKIVIRPVAGSRDSVDVLVLTKDVLSIGGSINIRNTTAADVSVKEENVSGQGNRLSVTALYDNRRSEKVGTGAEFIQRNIMGSFIDGYIGYKSFAEAFNGGDKQEKMVYGRLVRPLVNPYVKWTYLLEATYHTTQPRYQPDSVYQSDLRYRYYTYDAWAGLNTGAYTLTTKNEDGRLRSLVGLRVFRQLFLRVPEKFANVYNYNYADVTGILGSFSVFKQNFYKTNYVYGFGRNEDVPEGLDVTMSGGWINKQGINRPYAGVDLQKYFFTTHEAYFNFTGRFGTFWRAARAEDMDILLNMDYFSRLVSLGTKWKQRTFLSVGMTGQVNPVLNTPLFLTSAFGLPELPVDTTVAGDARITVKGESVFFSPLRIANFHFAPFVFSNLCLFTPVDQPL
ncbi:MAG TPA: hypothetical protein VLD19_06125, partial [Chitinophagaceae bacterium]|nr:hypothetical protein [Chitinophagaceae bacterium]